MKSLITIILTVVLSTAIFAQSPEKISYQAIIRDGNNNLTTNQEIGMQISILHGSENGEEIYVERHSLTTNANGLASLVIGNGVSEFGNFTNINWTNGPFYIKTEADINGGTDYNIAGTSELLSVPYALNAKTAENVFSGDYNDLKNQPILFDGSFQHLINLPTTIEGYGITDAFSGDYNDLINKPDLSLTLDRLEKMEKESGFNVVLSNDDHYVSYKVTNNTVIFMMSSIGDYAGLNVDVNQNGIVDSNIDRSYGQRGGEGKEICTQFLISANSSTYCGVESNATLSINGGDYIYTIPISELSNISNPEYIAVTFNFSHKQYPANPSYNDFSQVFFLSIPYVSSNAGVNNTNNSEKTISFPARYLSHNSNVTEDNFGLRWKATHLASGNLFIKKPADYSGGPVQLSIFFTTTSATPGTVTFFIRPDSFNPKDGFYDIVNTGSAGVSVEGDLGWGTFYEQKFIIPESRFSKEWWKVMFQRGGSSSTYKDDVIVMCVAFSYN